MLYRILADLTAIAHGAFVIFVAAGGLLVLRWPRVAWIHVPAAVWGVFIEIANRVCPLTAYENLFRTRAGLQGYGEDFIAHYLYAVLYPPGLTRGVQLGIAAFVLAANAAIYAKVFLISTRRSRRA